MKIIKTNIQENEYTMELMYAMFEDENRIRLSDTAGTTVEFDHYAIVEDENVKGEVVKTLSIEDAETRSVYVTTSTSFIQAFERIITMAEKCGEDFRKVSVLFKKSQRGRNFLVAGYVK